MAGEVVEVHGDILALRHLRLLGSPPLRLGILRTGPQFVPRTTATHLSRATGGTVVEGAARVTGPRTSRLPNPEPPAESIEPGALERQQILLMTVPPPRSGNVVTSLKRVDGVVSASAVYSGIDVVARLRGSEETLASTRRTIDNLGAPIDHIDTFDVHRILTGPRFHDSTVLLRGCCRAYIHCTINVPENTVEFAATVLRELSCTVAVYVSRDEPTSLILEVLATDKGEFDDVVMSKVQGEWAIVKSTRTYLVINNMSWTDWVEALEPAIFMSVSDRDNPFAGDLKRRIEEDTGLRCWKYDDNIPKGAADWPRSVDEAMAAAPLHIYVLSESFLTSGECQREFGQSVQMVRDPQDICALLAPGFEMSSLPERYCVRNCILGDRFLAYARLLDWLHERLVATASAYTDWPAPSPGPRSGEQ
ncbi:toll/interleukin-1 receptor domain-containing protein [Actinomycetospora aeridis]|uniref:Toll/interleukin-1 receptor domain-containing protein n=1 Tax=Actinomycetospora aeridis TaxID=3129231 RepID=A0ABU8MZS6_9PSEU